MRRKVSACEKLSPEEAALVINAALFLSNAIRKDTTLIINVDGLGIYEIRGGEARRLYPDWESLVGALKAVKKGKVVRGLYLLESCPPLTGPYLSEPSEQPKVDDEILIVPEASSLLERYSLDQVIVILQIELDRKLLSSKGPHNG